LLKVRLAVESYLRGGPLGLKKIVGGIARGRAIKVSTQPQQSVCKARIIFRCKIKRALTEVL